MALVHPFRGVRYCPGVQGGLSSVVAPPYDVISDEERDRLVSVSPHNVVRLTLPEPCGGLDRFQSSAALIDQWLKDGILLREEDPAIYLYRHEFEFEDHCVVRTGFIAALDLSDEDSVKRHEKTRGAHREDRLKLLRATKSFLGPIFMTYPDPGLTVGEIIAGTEADESVTVKLEDGVHTLGIVRDSAFHERVSELLRDRDLFIADGHHRYESALVNYRESRGSAEDDGWAASTLIYCVSMEDPGLFLLSTHRVLEGLPRPSGAYTTALKKIARIEEESDLHSLMTAMSGGYGTSFGMCMADGSGFFLVSLREPQSGKLDVEVLHEELLPAVFGAVGDLDIRYTHSAEDASKAALDDDHTVCLLLRGPSTADFERYCTEGRFMPAKSTYFYPKPLTGLVMKMGE